MAICNQEACQNPAGYRFTWPGQDEAFICQDHVAWLKKIAAAMSLHLQVIPFGPDNVDVKADGYSTNEED